MSENYIKIRKIESNKNIKEIMIKLNRMVTREVTLQEIRERVGWVA